MVPKAHLQLQAFSLERVSSYVQGSQLRIDTCKQALSQAYLRQRETIILFTLNPPVFSSGPGHTSCSMASCNSVCNVYDLLDVEIGGLNRCHA